MALAQSTQSVLPVNALILGGVTGLACRNASNPKVLAILIPLLLRSNQVPDFRIELQTGVSPTPTERHAHFHDSSAVPSLNEFEVESSNGKMVQTGPKEPLHRKWSSNMTQMHVSEFLGHGGSPSMRRESAKSATATSDAIQS